MRKQKAKTTMQLAFGFGFSIASAEKRASGLSEVIKIDIVNISL